MPMKLRDGKLYAARPTSQILLRDGKIVDHNKKHLAGTSGVVYDNNTMQDSPWKQTTTRTKGHFGGIIGGIEARSIGAKRGASPRSRMSDNFVNYESSTRYRYISSKQGLTSRIVDETTEFTETTSGKKPMTKKGRKKGLRMPSPTLIPNVKGKNYKNVPKDTSYSLGNSSFVTSTPVAFTPKKSADGTGLLNSFVISKRKTKTVEDGQKFVDSESKRFSKIVQGSRNRSDLETPVNRHAVSTSSCGERHESIEDSIFEDLSKPIIYSNTFNFMSDVDSPQPQPNLSTNMSFSYFDTRSSPSVSLNHARWSRYHHWRREWYLNRWSLNSVRAQSKRWLQKAFLQILSILISIQTFSATLISTFISVIRTIWFHDVKRHRKQRSVLVYHQGHYISHFSEESGVERRPSFCNIVSIRILICIIAILLISFLLWPHNISFGGSPVFNLTKHGMKNVRYLTFNEHRRIIPAWHVLPFDETDKSGVKNKYPVAFYIQNTYDKGITKRIEIFKVFSSAGYNVIIPIYPEHDLAAGWNGMRKLFSDSSVFLWGEKGVACDMQELAKDLCREGFPPTGVVIETEEKFDKNLHVKELEVWTCNCTTIRMGDGSPFSYSHVKCPLEVNNLSKDIVHCLQALA